MCTRGSAAVKSNTTLNYDIEFKTSGAYNATVKQPLITVSPNWNPTIVMLQAEAKFVSSISFSMSIAS
ncbi:hypothetical protein TNCV_363041 [Trichonephila clavipes]|nr:hypothetical protein TNCV_363041 [Trichonephila clavipes]